MYNKKRIIILIAVVLGFYVTFPTKYLIWDGSFSTAEYQIQFVKLDGTPQKNVQLRVENENGEIAFNFPVSDYHSKRIPSSDSEGVITFHHVKRSVEFSGKCRYMFLIIPVDEKQCRAPVFYCRFYYKEKEVYAINYAELNMDFNAQSELPSHTIHWKWPEEWPDGFPNKLRPIGEENETEMLFPILRKRIVLNL